MRIIPNITRAISITRDKIFEYYCQPDSVMLLFRIFDGLDEAKKTTSKKSNCADLFFDDTEINLNNPTKAPIVKLLIEILEMSGCAVEEIYVDSSQEHPRLAVTITVVSLSMSKDDRTNDEIDFLKRYARAVRLTRITTVLELAMFSITGLVGLWIWLKHS